VAGTTLIGVSFGIWASIGDMNGYDSQSMILNLCVFIVMDARLALSVVLG
jgi:hypothetical protein